MKLLAPVEKTYRLIELEEDLKQYDPNGEASATFRQATRAQEAIRSDLWSEIITEWNDDVGGTVRQIRRYSWAERQAMEIYLSLVTVRNVEGPDGKPVLALTEPVAKSMTFERFKKEIGGLPQVFVNALHEGALRTNPQWDPRVTLEQS